MYYCVTHCKSHRAIITLFLQAIAEAIALPFF